MHTVYLSLGSNIGDRKALMDNAVAMLGEQVGTVESISSYVETAPWGFITDNKFLNACVKVTTTLSPRSLLEATQSIERQLGRAGKSQRGAYRDRPMDIDILLYDDVHINDDDLLIPHPLMFEREFVMQPLSEIASPTLLEDVFRRMLKK